MFVLSFIRVVNGTHTVLRAWKLSYIIRYNVQFHLGDHLANGTTFAWVVRLARFYCIK